MNHRTKVNAKGRYLIVIIYAEMISEAQRRAQNLLRAIHFIKL